MLPSERHSPDPAMQMSVHSLPLAQASSEGGKAWAGRWKMLLIWLVCAAPVVASYFSYYVLKPQGRTNYGTLITPTQAMPGSGDMRLNRLDGKLVLPDDLKGQWLLVSVSNGACNPACEQHLYVQRQLREVLGREKDRVDRVWMVLDDAPVPSALMPALAQSWVLRVSPEAIGQWLAPEAGHQLQDHLYLIDPRGDWMMRFPANADPTRMKKDLMRLLKASESWDEAGR